MSDTVKITMKIFRGPDNVSIVEFHNIYGSFVDFNEKTEEIRESLEEIEEGLLEKEEKDE